MAVLTRVKAPLALFLFSKVNNWFSLSQNVNFSKLVLFHSAFIIPGPLLRNSHKLASLNIRQQTPLVPRVMWLLQGVHLFCQMWFASTFTQEEKTYAQYNHLQALAARRR